MERNIILNFIAQNFDSLSSIGLKTATICLYGKKYNENSNCSVLNGESLYVYNVKLPRIYSKVLPLDEIGKGILEFASTIDGTKVFSHDDFNFDLCEPYQNANISSLKFNYLYLVPLFFDNLQQGIILLYADNFVDGFNIPKSSLTNLQTQLISDDEYELNLALNNAMLDNECLYLIKNDNKFKASPELLKVFGKTVCDTELVSIVINDKRFNIKKLGFPFENVELYYSSKQEFNNDVSKILHLSSLKHDNLPKSFTMIVFEYENDIKKLDQKINLGIDYNLYNVDEGLYLIIFLKKVNLSILKGFTSLLDDYYLVINAPSDVNSSMDLIKVVNYVKFIRPVDFDYHDYLEYIESLCKSQLSIEEGFSKKKNCYNSIDESCVIPFINYVAKNLKFIEDCLNYEKKSLNLLNSKVLSNQEKIMVSFNTSTLLKRRFKEILKKACNNNISLSIILHDDGKVGVDELFESVALLNSNNVNVIVDTSILLNIKYAGLTEFINGIYLDSEEYNGLKNAKDEFANWVISYYFNKNLKVYLKLDDKSLEDKLKNKDIYYIK